MTCENYPIYKACSFLSVNYYEEISNTFEDYVTDALISENALISKENSTTLFNIDEFYRFPWKKAQYDEKFISSEAGNIEESITEICQDAFSSAHMPTLHFENTSYFSDAQTFNEEESVFEEKDLEAFKENTLDGTYQLLDVPYIPCALSNPTFKLPSVIDILRLLPIMEVDETLEDFDLSNEVMEAFYKENFDDEIKEVPKSNIENTFEEIDLPELFDEEISHLKVESSEYNGKAVSKFQKLNDNERESLNESMVISTSYQSENYSDTRHIYYDDHQLKCRNTILNNKNECHLQKKSSNVNNVLCLNDHVSLDSVSINENARKHIDENNEFDKMDLNINSSRCLQLIRNNELIDTTLKTDPLKNNSGENQDYNDESNVDEIISKVTAESSSYEGYSFMSSAFELNDKNQTGSSYEKNGVFVETIPECFSEFQYKEDNELVNDEKLVTVDSKGKNVYLKKISQLKFEKNLSLNDDCKVSSFLPHSENPKIFKSCTIVRRDNSLNSSLRSTNSENHDENRIPTSSQNLNSPQPVNLLSNFLNITKLANRNSTANSVLKVTSSPRDYIKDSDKDQITECFQKSMNSFSNIQSTPKKSTSLPELKVGDLLIRFPDEMLRILLLYEAYATPLLQSLLLSDLFKFPLKFTIVDISPCKTCFLLNQEVKRCRDENIDQLKNGGQQKSYYHQLLTFHGLLKSLECLIQSDLQLALSCLIEFQACHQAVIKGYYETLIEKFDSEMNNLTESNHIHPKVKEVSKFLKEKLNFCKETGLTFKVLVIIKKHLNIVYKAFEMALKKVECNIKTFLIPESVFLHESTLMFKSSEDTIYFVCPFSLSKKIPWKDLILVIEFEYDSNSNWKQICSEKKISHAFVQVIDLPFKSLEEIQKLNTAGKDDIQPLKENIASLIISASVTSQYQLLYLLESKLNIAVCIRQYKEILPHLHFADIVVNEKSALVLVSNVSFLIDDFPGILYERVSFLLLKYEICWIIVQEYKENTFTLKHKKSTENCWKFFLSIDDLCKKSLSCKIKILYAHNIEDTSDLIKNILSYNRNGYGLNISIPNHITNEEIFLMSFPSLNPCVVQHMMSHCSLHDIMNLTLDKLLERWNFIPERFLKCFYSTIHKHSSPAYDIPDESLEATPDSDHEKNVENNADFELKPNYQESFNFSFNFEDSEENLEQDIYEDSENFSYDNKTNLQHVLTNEHDRNKYSPEKSLQELDLDYMSLKLSNEFDDYSNYLSDDDKVIDNETKGHATKYAVVPPKSYNTQENDYSYSFESLNSQLPYYISHVRAGNAQENNDFALSLKKLDDRLDFLTSSRMEENTGKEVVSSSDSRVQDSEARPDLDFKQFMYTPRKRKFLSEDLVQSNDSKLSPVLKQSCKIQKGMVSKTVSKQDLGYNSSFNSQEKFSCPTKNVKQAKVEPFLKRDGCYSGYTDRIAKRSGVDENVDTFFKHHLSQWSDSSLPLKNSFPMTPLATRKLSYQKVPGVKGQTRLVFQ
ncbi:uncharacterized protein NPIL_545231 [Nephila pilipes]|uniref:Uncharacterized protein n=1 Tax=Nephila pilipes TaxID=299642 RepID=A0A8X6QGC1_NEPPI|nr:uncharacterized protein NPIL_545231 [Nephila pilipes]